MNRKPGMAPSGAMFSGCPVTKLSMQSTSQCLVRRKRARWEPMKPAPPVIRILIAPGAFRSGGKDRPTADGVILEAEPPHALRLPEISPIENGGTAHRRAQALQVEELELVPLRDERDGIGAGGCGIRRVGELHAG